MIKRAHDITSGELYLFISYQAQEKETAMIRIDDKHWSGKINSRRRTIKCRKFRALHRKWHSRQPFREWAREKFLSADIHISRM
ncbi:MAG: hypothetical protein UW94_C0004G0034 [Parcubacteria group bacterium GW2011_GWA2_45_14]|nr:MAG: hypothetical protein UW94_C0004G0034 [Parcubacteria group bacterium GW2011_GWA2_45_14]